MFTARARPGAPALRTVVVALAAGVVAFGSAGVGLLTPAATDPPTTAVRVGAAIVALAAVAVLVRVEGPLHGTRTLTVVAVAGALTTIATLPFSPVTIGDVDLPGPEDPSGPAVDEPGTVVLDRPGGGVPPSVVGTLVLPPGARLEVRGDEVVLTLPDGTTTVLGRTAPSAGAESATAAAPGARVDVGVVDGVVTRGDGGAIGGETPLGGVAFEVEGGVSVVVDGEVVPVPDPLAPAEGEAEPGAGAYDAVLAVLLAAFALLAFAPPVVRVAERLGPLPVLDDEPEPDPVPTPPATVEAGLADVLRAMLADPDPRTAVIGAYARLLGALGEAGFPRRPEETPHEHLWRSLGAAGVRRAPLHRLAELFVRARFTPHPVTEAHRQAAIGALADAVADLRLPAPDLEGVGADR